MKPIDVLLLNLPVSSNWKSKLSRDSSAPPLGLLYIASCLKREAYHVKLIDLAVETYSKENLVQMLEETQPAIVGLSTYCESWKAQKILTKLIKKILPQTIVVAGGVFASFCYPDIIKETDTDYVVLGEGEISMLKICDALIKNKDIDIAKTQGIVVRGEYSESFVPVFSERIKNLDTLPIPDRQFINPQKYTMPFSISTSRGCPGQCIFCSSNAFWGKKIYIRSAENIMDEILYLYNELSADSFHIADDSFTSFYKRVIEFCNRIKETGIAFTWSCVSRADIVTDDLLATLKDAGCIKIQFGFESADNEILRRLKKKVTVEQIENGIRLAAKHGLFVHANFIIGHVFDTRETIEKTIDFARYVSEKYKAVITSCVNTPFPGTEQYIKAEEYGLIIHSENWDNFMLTSPIISTQNLTLDEIRNYYSKGLSTMRINNRDLLTSCCKQPAFKGPSTTI